MSKKEEKPTQPDRYTMEPINGEKTQLPKGEQPKPQRPDRPIGSRGSMSLRSDSHLYEEEEHRRYRGEKNKNGSGCLMFLLILVAIIAYWLSSK